MSTCRSCGAKIEWVELKSGKRMPVDPDYFQIDEAEDGDSVVTDSGEVIRYRAGNNYDDVGDVRVSHFSTCPQADKWRRKK